MPAMRFRSPEVVMVRIPKTGSTSVIHGLLGGVGNAETLLGRFPDEWQNLYSFTFVRNPFDRLVSCFVMFQTHEVGTTEEEKNFRAGITLDRVMDVIEDPKIPIRDGEERHYFPVLKLHALPMTHPYFNLQKVKEFYRFENFQSEYARLAKKLGVSAGEIPHRMKTNRVAYQTYFTDAQRRRAEFLLRDDLREFGYSF